MKYFITIIFLLNILGCFNAMAQQQINRAEWEQRSLLSQKWLEQMQITENQQKYDVGYYLIDYNFNVSLNVGNPFAKVEIRLTVTEGPISEVELNLNPIRTVDSVKVDNIIQNFSHKTDILTVQLGRSYTNGENISVIVFYHGPSFTLEDSYGGKPLFWSLFEPFGARDAFPCKDTPADKADSADIIFTVPSEMTAVSNGLLVSETTENGNTAYWWKTRYPISTYLFFIAAYDYEHYRDWYVAADGDSMPLDFYVLPDHLENTQEDFYDVKNMLTIFAGLFGEYPFIKEKFGHAEILGSSGMEHQTCTSLGIYASSNGKYPLWLIIHEMSHQWWGDMVTCATFHHIWLNEGFATYSEALYHEVAEGKEAYKNYISGEEYFFGGTIYVEDPQNDDIFNGGLSYSKAAYVLHMLRHVVGDSVFFNLLKVYAADIRYKYKSITTEDFRDLCEQVSGLNLDKFFQQWIYEEYFPYYSYGVSYKKEASGYSVQLRLDQIQKEKIQQDVNYFWMPVDVKIITESFDSTFVVRDSLQSQTFEFFISEEPLDIVIDPDDWILTRTEKGQSTYPPYIENIKLNKSYQSPAEDILAVRSKTLNPDEDDIELTAFVSSADKTVLDNIIMYDDGQHYDSTAGDGIFGGYWPVPDGEKWYNVNIKAHSLTSGYYNFLPEESHFTSVGPVIIDTLFATGNDTIANPGDRYIRFELALTNKSQTDTVKNVTVRTVFLNPCTRKVGFYTPEFEFIAPGETKQGDNPFGINFADSCQGGTMDFALDIMSNGIVFWTDTFQVNVVVGLDDDDSDLPNAFALKQNFPNPFNSTTVINYQLAVGTYNYSPMQVELSIYNLLGQKVATLVDKKQTAGNYQVEWDASGFASGIYIYQLTATSQQQTAVFTKKLVLLK